MGDDLFLRIEVQAKDAASAAIKAIGGNMEALASVSELSLSEVGAAAEVAGGYLSTLGEQAFTTGVGFDGMAASAATVDASLVDVGVAAGDAIAGMGDLEATLVDVAVSSDVVVAGMGDIDASLVGVAVSSSAAVVGIGGVTAAADTYVVGMGGVIAETDAAAASMGGFAISEDAVAASTAIAEASLAAMGVALAAVGVAAGAAAVISTKMAGDFEQSMTQLETGAGEAHSNIKMVSDSILAMAPDVGQTTKELASGMYMIESASFHGSEGLNVLKNAAMGAKVGNAELKDVANGVTTALTDYGLSAKDSASVTNDLIATVASGKTTMGSLAASLKSILPVASTAGISLNGVSAALATMTGQGVPAGEAANHLRLAIMALEAPSTKGAATLKSIGLSSQQVASEMADSLPSALQMVTDHLKKKFPEGSAAYTAALKDISGGSGALSVMLGLTGDHMKTFKANVDNIFDATKKGGDSITGWSAVQGDFNTKMDQAKATLEVVGINIGTKLLPVLGNLMTGISSPAFKQFATTVGTDLVNGIQGLINVVTVIVGWITQFTNFLQHNQAAMTTFQIIMIAAGGAIAAIFLVWAGAAALAAISTLAAAWPILLIGAIIALVVAGIILAVQHWGQIVAWLSGVWGAFSAWFMELLGGIGARFTGLWKGLADWFTRMWNGIISFLQAAWGFIVNVIKIGALAALAVLFLPIVLMVAAFIWLYNHNYYFKMLIDAIIGFFVGCFDWCVNNWRGFIGWLETLWQSAVNIAGAAWGAVSGAVMAVVGFVVGWLRSQWSATIAVLGIIWGTLFGIAQGAWDRVTGVFRGAWGMISGALSGLWNSLVNWFNGWPSQFLAWGGNVINSFIQGIKDKIAGIGAALSHAADVVKNFLGFHSPTKEGPGSEADQWAPNFVKMYAKGLTDNMPLIQSAVNKLSTPIGISALSSSNASVSNSFVGKGSSSSSGGSAGGATVVHQTFNISVTTQGGWSRAQVDDLTKQVEDKLSRKLRGSGILTTQTSGGAQ